jgi:hypothetical protein
MVQARQQVVFPDETVFFRLDGVHFASLPDDRWFAVDDSGHLVTLSEPYAAEISRMINHAEVIDADAFRVTLACDACLP